MTANTTELTDNFSIWHKALGVTFPGKPTGIEATYNHDRNTITAIVDYGGEVDRDTIETLTQWSWFEAITATSNTYESRFHPVPYLQVWFGFEGDDVTTLLAALAEALTRKDAGLAERLECMRATCQRDIRAAISLLTKLSGGADSAFGGITDSDSPAAQHAHLTRVVADLGGHLTELEKLRSDGWHRMDEIHGEKP